MMRKKGIIITVLLTILSLTIFAFFSMAGSNQLKINIGHKKVSKEAFLYFMEREKYDVTQYFQEKYEASVTEGFWTRKYGNEYPYKMLLNHTLKKLKNIRATYKIAKINGYINDIGFDAIQKRWKQENKTRARKIEEGKPVYGLAHYPFHLYIVYEQDALQKKYMSDLENKGMSISKKEGRQYYNKIKNKMFKKRDDIKLEFLRIYYASLELKDSKVYSLKQQINEISKKIDNDTTIKSLIQNKENLQPYYQREEVLAEEAAVRSRKIGDVLVLAKGLKEGETTDVIDKNGSIYLIRCINRVEHDYIPYKKVRGNVFKMLREKTYKKLVSKKAKHLTVSGDMDQLDAFVKEHLKNK